MVVCAFGTADAAIRQRVMVVLDELQAKGRLSKRILGAHSLKHTHTRTHLPSNDEGRLLRTQYVHAHNSMQDHAHTTSLHRPCFCSHRPPAASVKLA